MDKSVKLANDFYGENKHGKAIHKLLKGNWDTSRVQSYLERLGGGDDTKWVGILDFISKYVKLDTTQYDTMGEQLPVLLDKLESLYGVFIGGGVSESINESKFKKGDTVRWNGDKTAIYKIEKDAGKSDRKNKIKGLIETIVKNELNSYRS